MMTIHTINGDVCILYASIKHESVSQLRYRKVDDGSLVIVNDISNPRILINDVSKTRMLYQK